MDWSIFTKWYTLLPAALSVGPVFSLLGIDAFVHELILDKGGGKSLISKSDLTRTLDSIVVGSPFWIAVSSIFLQPFWGGSFPVKYVTFLLTGGLLKTLYGRSCIYDTAVSDSSRWWNPIWQRKPDNLWDEVGRMFTKFAYPSMHMIAVAGAVLFGVHSPAAWVLLGLVTIWLLLVHHHWLSDILSGLLLTGAAVNLLGQ